MILMFGCKDKEIIPPQESDPVFKVSGKVDGSSVEISAGKDDYYMFTSYHLGPDNVHTFTGDLKPVNCTNCKEALKIEIRDNGFSNNFNVNDALAPGDYAFISENPVGYKVTLTAEPEGIPPYTFFWNADNIQQQSISPTMEFFFKEEKKYNISLTITYGDSCSSTITNEIDLASSCSAGFELKLDSGIRDIAIFKAYNIDQFTKYTWEVNNAIISNKPSDTYTFPKPGIYEFCLTVDSAGCTAKYCRKIEAISRTCVTNFRYKISPPNSDTLNFSSVKITWIDKNGDQYTTGFRQSANDYFRILDSEDYKSDIKGNPTRKLNLEFNCTVYNSIGDSLQLQDFRGIIGVAYPR